MKKDIGKRITIIMCTVRCGRQVGRKVRNAIRTRRLQTKRDTA